VSLFPTEHLSVSLMPAAIGIAVHRGRWRPLRADLLEVPIEEPGLESMLKALPLALKDTTGSGATVRFTVSNRFCRVALLPWAGEHLTASERQILVQHEFSDLYGEMEAWEIRSERTPAYGRASLAIAMPGQLLDALREIVRTLDLDCRSISAHAVDSWNRNGARMRGEGLFAVIEPDSAFLMTLHASGTSDEIASARLVAFESGSAAAVESLVERERLLQGIPNESTVLCDTLGTALHGDHFAYPVLPYAADILSPAMAMAVNGMAA
jgi:hypothetical protein